MKISNPLGARILSNPLMKSLDGNDAAVGNTFTDWQIVVSRDKRVLEVKQMTIDMPNTRLKPIYSATGDLTIVILAESRRAAESRGQRIADRIASAGLWGLDFLDLVDLDFDK
ncbi:MAG TPA: hypothetical protein PL001_09300 [Candidatus Kryptobacter bacterium]|nr:hypothetical protein [Candidatus Kryptobacter bacterium]